MEMKAPGSSKWFGPPWALFHEKSRLVSTTIWPCASSSTCARSIGRGAGPSKLIPSGVYPLPWHGHLNLFSADFQSGGQPKCVQRAKMQKRRVGSFTTQIRASCLNLSLTPNWKSEAYPIRKQYSARRALGGKKSEGTSRNSPPDSPRCSSR